MVKRRRERCETRSGENRREMRSSAQMNVEVLSHAKINHQTAFTSLTSALAKVLISSKLRGRSPSVDSRVK